MGEASKIPSEVVFDDGDNEGWSSPCVTSRRQL